MSLTTRSNHSQELWAALLPHITAPEPSQFVVWANRFTDPQIERAFMRTQRRFAPERVSVNPGEANPIAVHRYVTGLLVNIEREQKHVA
jgi:hypothetical protein